MSGAWRFSWAVALALTVLAPVRAQAINADPAPHEFVQPDGTRIRLMLRGDEYLHWQEDVAGHPVVLVGSTWRYARLDESGSLVATPVAVGAGSPESAGSIVGAHPRLSEAARSALSAALTLDNSPHQRATTPLGVVKNLVVLCLFSDHTVAAQGRAPAAYDSLFNAAAGPAGPNAPTGSVKYFYNQASYGYLTLNSTVLAWVTLPQSELYYADTTHYGLPFANGGTPAATFPRNAAGMVRDALAIVDGMVNFADFDTDLDGFVDAIDFIHSGWGGEVNGNGFNSLWSHKGNLTGANSGAGAWVSADKNSANVNVKVDTYHTEPARWGNIGSSELVHLGVIAHETGHFFGLPDLYDHNSGSSGLGNWCTMANSWGWDQTQLYPPLFSAWCKLKLGWVTPQYVTAPGTYVLGQSATTQGILQTSVGMQPNEYLLIENREPTGFDQQIPRGGIAVYQCDDNIVGNDSPGFPGKAGWPTTHGAVTLLQADGKYDLEKNNNKGDAGDLYRFGTAAVLNESTFPNSDSHIGSALPTGDEVRVQTLEGTTMTVAVRPGSWLDVTATAPETGSFLQPFHTLTNAVFFTPNYGGIIMKSGTSHELPTLSKPLWFRAWNGVATIGR